MVMVNSRSAASVTFNRQWLQTHRTDAMLKVVKGLPLAFIDSVESLES